MSNVLLKTMEETLEPKQREIMKQFFPNGEFCIDNFVGLPYKSDARKKLQTVVESFLNSIYSKFGTEKPVANSEYVYVQAELGFNGGNICFREFSEQSELKKYEDNRHGMNFSKYHESYVLIKPANYPSIEPYKCQTPHYVPYSYKEMKPLKSEHFRMFYKHMYYPNGMCTISRLKANYNCLYLYSEMNIFVKKNQLIEFMNEYLKVFIPEEKVKDRLIRVAEKFLRFEKSK